MKKALVLSLAAVLGLGFASFAQTLSGSWDTYINIDPTPVVLLTIDSTLKVTYEVSGWSFTSTTVVDENGWQKQWFDVSGALGAFTIGSTINFDPTVPEFDKWTVTGGLSLAGVTFDGTFTLEPNIAKLVLEATGSAGSVDVGATLTLGGVNCGLDFNSVVITVDFPFCCAEVASKIAFNCTEGFDYVSFTVEDIALPGIDWVTLKAVLTFEVGLKKLVVTPAFDFGATACFDVYLSTPTAIFGTVTIDGIGIECEIGGVSFTGISWLNENTLPADKPGLLHDTLYWEAYQISTTDDGCCGPFTFDVAIFFDHGGELFDVAAIQAGFDIQISTQFTFGMSIDYIMATGFNNWALHFLVEW